MLTTITLKQVSCGTELNIVQEGIPEVIPAEACYLGWQESSRCWHSWSRLRFRIKRARMIHALKESCGGHTA